MPSSGVKTVRDKQFGPALVRTQDIPKLRAALNGERLPDDPSPQDIVSGCALIHQRRREAEQNIDAPRERVRQSILKFLRINGASTIRTIAAGTDLTQWECLNYVRELENAGKIEPDNQKRGNGYSIAGDDECSDSADNILSEFRRLAELITP